MPKSYRKLKPVGFFLVGEIGLLLCQINNKNRMSKYLTPYSYDKFTLHALITSLSSYF